MGARSPLMRQGCNPCANGGIGPDAPGEAVCEGRRIALSDTLYETSTHRV